MIKALLVIILRVFISFKGVHPENIQLILFILLVLKLEKFILFHEEHPENK